MIFSEQYTIERAATDDWFDPELSFDTSLFVDPFLVFESGHPAFVDSYERLMAYFTHAYTLAARSGGDTSSQPWRALLDMLTTHEVAELCLGYSRGSTAGSGPGRGYANRIADAIGLAVAAGLTDLAHFEHIALLGEGIGCDRISDLTTSILRPELVAYTEGVCRDHRIPTRHFRFQRGTYSTRYNRWMPMEADLPLNPASGRAVLLVPQSFLDSLPEIGADGFERYLLHNEAIRTQLGMEVSEHIPREQIAAIAQEHPDWVRNFVEAAERRGGTSYDFNRDPLGLYAWREAAQTLPTTCPLDLTANDRGTFVDAIDRMLGMFQHYVEQQGGWTLLWDGATDKPESAAQTLLMGVVVAYCRANDIDVTREANVGRGPVDFKFSHGYEKRAVLEIKKANNTRWAHGLTTQLPTYMGAELTDLGFFMLVMYRDADQVRAAEAERIVREVSLGTGATVRVYIVDARPKPSASHA